MTSNSVQKDHGVENRARMAATVVGVAIVDHRDHGS